MRTSLNSSIAKCSRHSLEFPGASAPSRAMRPSMPAPRHSPDDSIKQPGLFSPAAEELPRQRPLEAVAHPPTLTPTSTLGACALPYREHLRRTDHSEYTVTCFLSDLHLLAEFLGRDMELQAI